ncbi:LysR family transcriptional regulator [Acinetobacter baumannii]|uniref:LysR family transcriptional regulator n=1 Tax=Acinetobacter baumannii TaxID=470 RepID=UPI000AD78410|nr:LysR family transcriptional regulator [Acinetobacter baumannii]MDF9675753.1 LysR family transcriptional regulator [Acinetobacter baumannii]MDF9690478.1 LysR family transcriptional regulator [Acinetobacter baumannii]
MIEMEIKQLRTFITIIETENLTRASSILNIVQPAVTKQLQLLEEELGVQLFHRSRHGMSLTEDGKVLEPYARRILDEVDNARFELTNIQQIRGKVHIGVLSSISELLSSLIMHLIKEKYPDVQVKISVGYSGHLKEWLEAGDIDLALMYDSTPSKFIDLIPLVQDKLFLVGPMNSSLDETVDLDLKEISKLPLILPFHPHRLRALIEQAFGQSGSQLNIYAETNDLSVQKKLVIQGHGYTILPLVSVKSEHLANVVKVAPIHNPAFTRVITLATHSTRNKPKHIRVIAQEVIGCVKQSIIDSSWPRAVWVFKEK